MVLRLRAPRSRRYARLKVGPSNATDRSNGGRVSTTSIDTLQQQFRAEVITRAHPGYDNARAVWNAMIDRRPLLIVQPETTAEVVNAVAFARRHDLPLSVKGGGHGVAGRAICDDGLVVDLSRMATVGVDPVARTATVLGGATLRTLDAAAHGHGLATTAGIYRETGVAGLALGGGVGLLMRRFGLTCDSLLAAEVVTADGRILTASPEQHPDLFWAIRGGGGNFGVVTAFDFRLHPVPEMVDFGLFFWPSETGPAVLRLARQLIPGLPPSINVMTVGLNAPPQPFVPEEHRFRPGYALLVTGFEAPDEHAAVAERIRREVPPLFDLVTPMPYLQLQQLLDEANAFGFLAYDKGLYLEDFSDAVIDVIAEQLPRKSSPRSVMIFYRLDGAYGAVAEDATAFSGGRSPRYACFLIGLADNQEMYEADREWVRSFWAALQPLAITDGSYVNGEAEPTDAAVRGSYGAKYARLAQIKAAYDPDNVFHLNANIPPAARPPQQRSPGDRP